VNFTDPPTQRSTGILRNLRGGERHEPGSANPGLSPESATDSRFVYPLTLHHNGRTGGPYILYAESAQIRSEWQKKLVDALGLRKAIQDSNKVFEVEYLSRDTFIIPSIAQGANGPTWNQDSQFTGKVTCSVPFSQSLLFLFCITLDVQYVLFLQTLRMDVHLSLLVVRKVFGLDSDMILNVSDAIPSKATNSLYKCFHSHSASSPSEDGYTMRHA
jgi:hypothetical protein